MYDQIPVNKMLPAPKERTYETRLKPQEKGREAKNMRKLNDLIVNQNLDNRRVCGAVSDGKAQ